MRSLSSPFQAGPLTRQAEVLRAQAPCFSPSLSPACATALRPCASAGSEDACTHLIALLQQLKDQLGCDIACMCENFHPGCCTCVCSFAAHSSAVSRWPWLQVWEPSERWTLRQGQRAPAHPCRTNEQAWASHGVLLAAIQTAQ